MKKSQNAITSRKKLIIFDIIILLLTVLSDRGLKYFAIKELKAHPAISLIDGILELTYLENSGAAFGLLKGQKAFFILVTAIVLTAVLYLFIKMPAKRKYNKAHIALSFLLGGALGNLTDRVLYGYVIDFIYISKIRFPVFNLADIYVTAATLFIVILLLFIYKEDDLNILRFKEKRLRDVN